MTVSNWIWWSTLPVAAVGALALTLTLGGGNDRVAPPTAPDQAQDTQHPELAPTRVATSAVPAPAPPAVSVSPGNAPAGVEPGNQRRSVSTSPEMLKRAQALREADLAATRGQGPAEACLAQMKMVFCPIIGNMPFVRDVAGQVAMWGHFDCPTATRPRS